jgi:hypothetical protein
MTEIEYLKLAEGMDLSTEANRLVLADAAAEAGMEIHEILLRAKSLADLDSHDLGVCELNVYDPVTAGQLSRLAGGGVAYWVQFYDPGTRWEWMVVGGRIVVQDEYAPDREKTQARLDRLVEVDGVATADLDARGLAENFAWMMCEGYELNQDEGLRQHAVPRSSIHEEVGPEDFLHASVEVSGSDGTHASDHLIVVEDDEYEDDDDE